MKDLERTWALRASLANVFVYSSLMMTHPMVGTLKGICFFDPATVSSPAGKRPEQPLA